MKGTPYLPDPSFEDNFSCDLTFELQAWATGYRRVAGIDEVGRGALFGPVCAAAVLLNPEQVPAGVDDSKKLTPKKRIELAEELRRVSEAFAVAFVAPKTIDEINILEATREAMRNAICSLVVRPDFLLCDGILITSMDIPQRSIVKGDARSVSIAAASIIAKVERDRLMQELDLLCPGYGLSQNKGYGTPDHREALRRLGPSPLHRRSFRGVGVDTDVPGC